MIPAHASPILKWAGGKSWAAKEFGDDIFAILQMRGFGTYIEPFLGGGAMALWLGWSDMILADIEEDLIEVYQALQEDYKQVHSALGEFSELDEAGYYEVRDNAPDDWDSFYCAARVIYLNKRCYNGLYRKNASGRFNVSYGKWKGPLPKLPELKQLHEVSNALKGARISVNDFEKVIRAAGDGDVVYADPPYAKTFDKYSPGEFGLDDHKRLAIALKAAAHRGASVFAHNSHTQEILDLYQWAEIVPVYERRSISSKGDDRKPAPCVFIALCPTLG
jgi:DNA adenine methylase